MAEPTWIDADKKHRQILPTFTCTSPRPRSAHGRTRAHPKPWEYEVQAYIRQLKPPVQGNVTRLGMVGEALGSVAQFVYQMGDEVPMLLIKVAAISVEYRGQGGLLADATIEAILDRGATDLVADGWGQALVVARVNLSNTPSQALLMRHGFQPDGRRNDDLQEWTVLIDW